jgi:predicted O-linked N-acetylglucosamine transferase (SPINDLY family)
MATTDPQQLLVQAEETQRRGKNAEAAPLYQKFIAQQPDSAVKSAIAWHGLGRSLVGLGRVDEAIDAYRRSISLAPNEGVVHYNLGVALFTKGHTDQAIAEYRKALALRPDDLYALANLGSLLPMRNEYDQAIAVLRRAIRASPSAAPVWLNLGNVLKDVGEIDAAMAHYNRAVVLQPDDPIMLSNRIYATLFYPGFDPPRLLAEAQRWEEKFGQPLRSQIRPHANDAYPDRRLRIGYVSPDLRDHCQTHFTLPLLSNHDHANFEIICYSSVARPDRVSARLRSFCDGWRNVAGASDPQLAQLICDDAVDVLVDLTMHMAGSRLSVFARKPAPVQVAYLAYPGTTGLSAMDYRLTDPYLDPPGAGDEHYCEKSIRLPNTFWCYDPLAGEESINELPAKTTGQITFGCLNNFCKTTELALDLWAKVLTAVPTSRLLLLVPPGSARQRVLNCLSSFGIAADRIELIARQPRIAYLQTYNRIDIALDTIPYNGHTTSLDAFWMGVPVVTLVGNTVVGRAGLSQLSNLGLSELAAESPDQFVRIASDLASDLPRLGEIRSTLRRRMTASPLMDAPLFARHIEEAYRQMWREWCQKRDPKP